MELDTSYVESLDGGGGITGLRADGSIRDNVSKKTLRAIGARLPIEEVLSDAQAGPAEQPDLMAEPADVRRPLQAARLAVAGALSRFRRH